MIDLLSCLPPLSLVGWFLMDSLLSTPSRRRPGRDVRPAPSGLPSGSRPGLRREWERIRDERREGKSDPTVLRYDDWR